MTVQLHDFNAGIAPTGLFWTIRIPDDALTVHGRTARLRLVDVPVVDSKVFLGPDETPARVSLDVTWEANGRAKHFSPGSSDPTDPTHFAATFRAAVASGSFSGSAEGFSFHGQASSAAFAEMGEERNGVFLDRGDHDEHLQDDATLAFRSPVVTTTRALPNPARFGTDVAFSLAASGRASVRIFDVTGRLVAVLADQSALSAGAHSVHWDLINRDGERVSAGVYLVQIRTASGEEVRRLAVLER